MPTKTVDALIERVQKQYPGQSPSAQARYFDAVHQELAPLARSMEKAAKRLLTALDRLDEGCREPGFAGWENGNGEQVGDEAENARQALRALLK